MEQQRIPFSTEDEECIASAGMWGMIIGITSIVSTFLSTIFTFFNAAKGPTPGFMIAVITLPAIIAVAITVILAVFLLQASAAFRKVALTDEADQHYLMRGFTKLRNYFMMMGIMFIIGASLVGVVFLFSLTCGLLFKG